MKFQNVIDLNKIIENTNDHLKDIITRLLHYFDTIRTLEKNFQFRKENLEFFLKYSSSK